MRFTIFVFAILTAITFGCSSGGSSNPVAPQDNNEARSVLCSAADNLEKGDLDGALQFFFNRDKNERILRRLKNSWPILAKAIRDARIEENGRDTIKIRLRLTRPDKPNEFVEPRFYLVRPDGENGKWLLSPVPLTHRYRDERNAAWGTNTVHGSYLTRSIIEYYIRNYPEDYDFIGANGFLRQNKYLYQVKASHPGPVDSILGIYDIDIYENIPPDAVIVGNAPTSLIQIGSIDEDVFLGEFDVNGNLVFNRDINLDFSSGIKFIASTNYGENDDTFFKGYAHFLTPLNQSYIQESFIGFNDMGILGDQSDESAPAIQWALGMEKIGPVNIIDIVDMRENKNRKTWQYAIQQYKDAMKEPNPVLRGKKIADSFYALGHVLHLLEDSGIPAHVRNDMHGVPALSYIPGFDYLQPDPLEDWSDTWNMGEINQSFNLFFEELFAQNPIIRYENGFSTHEPLLYYYYNHPQLPEYAGFEAIFKSLAFMTNRTFFSEDTIHRSTQSYADTSTWPRITDWEFNYGGRTVIYGKAELPFYNEVHPLGVSTTYFDVWALGFWVLNWRWPNLDEVISALGDGEDLFTQWDEYDEDYFTNGNIGVCESAYNVQFKRIVRHGAALIHEFYLETHKS